MNTDIKKLSDSLKSLTVEDISKLLNQLSIDLDINLEKVLSASNTSDTTTSSSMSEDTATKKKYEIKILSLDKDKQMALIKAFKEFKDCSLLEAKKLLDNPPVLLKDGILKEDADIMQKNWEALGAKVEITEES